VKLQHVRAFESVDRKKLKVSRKSKYKKSEDESKLRVKPPCFSCKIFFKRVSIEKKNAIFPPFGNCAEYDVIQTPGLDLLLHQERNDWRNFKSACDEHFKAFNELTKKLENSQNLSTEEILEEYYTNTCNGKVLKYQWDDVSGEGYKLVAMRW
jgi:hypothetical protein